RMRPGCVPRRSRHCPRMAGMMTAVFDHFAAAWDEMLAPESGFAMETIEVRGVPMRVFKSAPPHMRAVWEMASLRGDTTYLVYEDERYSYGEVAAQVRALAHWLRDTHGVGSGDRVAVAMRNYPEWVVSYWAVASLGAALVGMNAWWTPKEMTYGVRDSQPKVLIRSEEHTSELQSRENLVCRLLLEKKK